MECRDGAADGVASIAAAPFDRLGHLGTREPGKPGSGSCWTSTPAHDPAPSSEREPQPACALLVASIGKNGEPAEDVHDEKKSTSACPVPVVKPRLVSAR